MYVALALHLKESRNFVWLFEHMLLLVECMEYDLCRRSVMFQPERWVCFFL
jgi:hypothetical protein